MRKFAVITASILLALPVLAADRENYTVGTLDIGVKIQPLNGVSTRVTVSNLTVEATEAVFDGTVDADAFTSDAGSGLDNKAAGTLPLGAAVATLVSIGASDADTTVLGALTVLGGAGKGVDTTGAVDLELGAATATSVTIADAGVTTTVEGPLVVQAGSGNGVDTEGAATLFIGEATATALTLGASDITTTVAGPMNASVVASSVDGTASITLTSAHYGTIVMVTNGAAVAITLPANGAPAGTWIDIAAGAQTGSGADACVPTVSAATADTLVVINDAEADSVTWPTGHRINLYARFWSDGEFWHAVNLGPNTMNPTS